MIDELKSLAGWYLGYGRDESRWDSEQRMVVDDVVSMAIRRIHLTEEVPSLGIPAAYPWSFLRPVVRETLLKGQSELLLSEDFGGLDSDVRASEGDSAFWSLKHVPLSVLRSEPETAGRPVMVSLDWRRIGEDRALMVVRPVPSSDVVLTFRYYLTPRAMSCCDKPYGAEMHEELYKAAVKACAELEVDGEFGEQNQYFLQRLVASIRADQNSSERHFLFEDVPSRRVVVSFNGVRY